MGWSVMFFILEYLQEGISCFYINRYNLQEKTKLSGKKQSKCIAFEVWKGIFDNKVIIDKKPGLWLEQAYKYR